MYDCLYVNQNDFFYIPLSGSLSIEGKEPYRAGSIMNNEAIIKRLHPWKFTKPPICVKLEGDCQQSFLLEVPMEKYVTVCRLWKESNKPGNPF